MTLTPEQVQAIRERCEAATPGPWREGRHDMVSYEGLGDGGPYKNVYADDKRGGFHHVTGDRLPFTVARGEGDEEECISNASFIAHARQDIPNLLTALRSARRDLALKDAVVEAARELGLLELQDVIAYDATKGPRP